MGKRSVLLLGMVLCLLALLSGCGGGGGQTEKPAEEEITLWILTEKTESSGMNDQAKAAIRRFEAAHPGIMVDLEILPESGQERELRLEQLRTQIMAGGGPDGYLLPTQIYQWQEPVFPDVEQAMRAGLFADLSAYYDADADLDIQALQQTVMDAGVVDGARYTLPLRYELPVVYLDEAQLKTSGLDREKMASGLYGFWDEVLNSGRAPWELTARMETDAMQLLPPIYDYARERICLSQQTLRAFLERWQQMNAALGRRFASRVGMAQYWGSGSFFSESLPGEVGRLDMAFSLAAIAKSRKQPIVMFPLANVEGETVASVTYFAAAGVGSRDLDLTYALLREFLTEESQWEQNRERIAPGDPAVPLERGWPVRYRGAAQALWEKDKAFYAQEARRAALTGHTNTGHERLLQTALTDEDVPVLSAPIDRAVYVNGELFALLNGYLEALNDWDADNAATDADLDRAAKDALAALEKYLAEG